MGEPIAGGRGAVPANGLWGCGPTLCGRALKMAGTGRLAIRLFSGCGWVRGSDSAVLSRLRDEAVVHPGFLSQEEEDTLTRELEPQLRRRRYEYDHWDAVSGRSGELRGRPLGHDVGAGSSDGQSEELRPRQARPGWGRCVLGSARCRFGWDQVTRSSDCCVRPVSQVWVVTDAGLLWSESIRTS